MHKHICHLLYCVHNIEYVSWVICKGVLDFMSEHLWSFYANGVTTHGSIKFWVERPTAWPPGQSTWEKNGHRDCSP